MLPSPRRRLLAVVAAAGLAMTACTGVPQDSAAGTELVLADAQELGGYNPVAGHGELGVSPLYEGLLALHSTGDEHLPTLEPRLAASQPTVSKDLLTWDVPLRQGVRFHDGSSLDAADVVATYRAVLDPASASQIATSFAMVRSVSATTVDGAPGVRFVLKYPYADFGARLLLGIAPSEKLDGRPVAESTLNTHPVGTGPYRLTELSADKAVFEAFEGYWAGRPQVTRLTTLYMPDDNSRAQRLAAGDVDGANLPPALARTFEGRQGLRVVRAHTADWRGVSLPADNPFTQDPAVRIALNLAVNRQQMVDTILAGAGTVAHTPVPAIHREGFEPSATFPHDIERARRMLASAGWKPGPDGILTKDGRRASFTVAHTPDDVLRRELATAFAADLRAVGVEVKLEALGWDRIEPQYGSLGIMLGGGDKPYSLDTQLFGALHSPIRGNAYYDNPGGFGSQEMDAALEQARRTASPTRRHELYREIQRRYLANPGYVMLVFTEHAYVMRDDGWETGPLVVEPHAHGVAWGPWWKVQEWRR